MQWEPVFSFVSVSGDMAYNYGPYKYTATDAKGNQQTGYGYFVTVWKKQPDNSWKFVLDPPQKLFINFSC
jgi:ketosteroid isomerase-like protein